MSAYVLYDYLQVAGGAERLSLDLVSQLPGFQLVVSRVFPQSELLLPDSDFKQKHIKCIGSLFTRSLQRVPEAMMAFRFNTAFLKNAKTVIYSGLYAPFAVVNQERGQRIYYCHTPPRYAYDWSNQYMARVPLPFQPIAKMVVNQIRGRYEYSLKKMDRIIANSQNVSNRLNQYLGIEAEVIHPPVNTERFQWLESGNYFLSTARLEPYKRIDLIIKAFLDTPKEQLIIASGGSDEARLKALAKGAQNIIFKGWQTDGQLCRLVGEARAVIYIPVDEDFGMSPVEAMSAGKPVIGVNEGGLIETIIDGVTGVLISRDITAESLRVAIGQMTKQRAITMRSDCEERAMHFSKKKFIDQMRGVIVR